MSSWTFLNLTVLATVGYRVILCNAGKNGNVVPDQIFREVQGGFLGIAIDLAPKFYPVLSSLQRFGEVHPDFGPRRAGIFRVLH